MALNQDGPLGLQGIPIAYHIPHMGPYFGPHPNKEVEGKGPN